MTLKRESLTPSIGYSMDVASARDAVTRNGVPMSKRLWETTVLMSIRVDAGRMRMVREALHRALGSAVGVYVVSIDHRNARASLQVEMKPAWLHKTMAVIMRTLPEAEFGGVRPSRRELDH